MAIAPLRDSALRLRSFLAALCIGRKPYDPPHSPEVPPWIRPPESEVLNMHEVVPLAMAEPPTKSVHNLMLPEESEQVDNVLPLNDKNPQMAPVPEDIEAQFRTTLSLPDNDVNKPFLLKRCGDMFLRCFRIRRTKEAIDQAVSGYKLALRSLPQEDEIFLLCLCAASDALLERFELDGTLSDINDAVSNLETAISRTPDEHSAKAERLNSLGITLVRRFNRTENLSDINHAIANQQRAVKLTPEGHEDLHAWLNNVGTSLCTRFQFTGAMNDINDAICYQERAVNTAPSNHFDLAAWLSNLGSSYSHRFDHAGDLSDISSAISYSHKSIHLTPPGHNSLPGRLNNLAISYSRRFKTKGDRSDLSNAISNQQRVVKLTSDDDLRKSGWLNNLGVMYQQRFKLENDPEDITNAIATQQKAIELTPNAHSHLPIMLSNLGISYLARFRLDGRPEDISLAVSSQERAVQLTPFNHSELPSRLACLGNACSRRFERTGDVDDLATCISSHERAVQLTPEGNAFKSQRLESLGKAYLRRSKHTKQSSDMALAISQYRMSATDSYGGPSTRLYSAKLWAGLSRLTDPQQSFEAYGVAIDLMSRVAGLDQTVQKRHTELISISSLTTDAAATAFSKGEYLTALEWLEQGRCLVWSQLNQLRTPLDDLSAYDEALARRLLAVSNALENMGSRNGGSASEDELDDVFENNIILEDQTKEHIKLAQEWDILLTKIREIAQFKDFLQPRKAQDILAKLPKIGFVVLINVHQRRCDALILHCGSDPVHVPLRDFSYKQAEVLRDQLRQCLKEHGVRMRQVMDRSTFRLNPTTLSTNSMQGVLHELWKCIVLPVLAHLNVIQEFLTKHRTRIWWCATGPLDFLPIHAAGVYGGDVKPSLSLPQFAVSSYTPTVGSLVDRIQEKRDRGNNTFLLISQPNTPNLSAIPGAREEAQALAESLNSEKFEILYLDDIAANIDRVKMEMTKHPWIHLACHAVQDTTSPLKSGFHLHDGRLELGEIIKQRYNHADFAFLSACQTSAGDEKLSEEAVHLAAGMLAAGYRSVVSTTWSISDNYGPEVAKEFYAYLFKQRINAGEDGLSGASAAYALDYAMHRIREKVKDSEDGLLTWVPYVHFGL